METPPELALSGETVWRALEHWPVGVMCARPVKGVQYAEGAGLPRGLKEAERPRRPHELWAAVCGTGMSRASR